MASRDGEGAPKDWLGWPTTASNRFTAIDSAAGSSYLSLAASVCGM